MKELLWDWRFVIAVVLGLTLWVVFNWERAKVIAYNGMLRAKSLAKDKILNSGQEQEDWVVINIYPCLPSAFRLFVNEEAFRRFVRWLYGIGKDWLDDGVLNGSNKPPAIE